MRLALSLCLLATPIAAQDVDCANASAQVELTYCAEQDWMEADADLNAAYKAAMALMKQSDADLAQAEQGAAANLKAAQRAWIAYRDAQASFDSHHLAGGTMEGLEYTGSLNMLTQARTKRLREDLARFR